MKSNIIKFEKCAQLEIQWTKNLIDKIIIIDNTIRFVDIDKLFTKIIVNNIEIKSPKGSKYKLVSSSITSHIFIVIGE